MTKYTADVIVRFSVTFDDDGENALVDQAFDAANGYEVCSHNSDIELLASSVRPA